MAARKKAGLPRRQIVLLLAVLAVPCLVLVGLGLRIQQQERQLAARRTEEDRRRQVTEIRAELLSTLERIKRQAMAGRGQDAVVLIGEAREGQLELPFDGDEGGRRFRRSLADSEFGARMRRGEQVELMEGRAVEAAELYRTAAAGAADPRERAYAKLLQGRALRKAARRGEALRVYGEVAATPAELRDEYGMPWALYAATSILEQDGDASVVRAALGRAGGEASRLGLAALYRLRDLAGEAGVKEVIPGVERWIGERRQAEGLRAEFPRLVGRLQGDDAVWAPFGEPMLLVSLAARTGSEGSAVIAVDPARLAEWKREGVQIVAGKEGDPLGEAFPGLRAVIRQGPTEAAAGGRLLTVALAVVMGLTFVAGYLLWRDVQRSARLAELRAEFVASVSHELRTPLTSIRMYTELLRMDDEMEAEARAEYLETILHESQRLSRLVDNVLQFSRMEQGRVSYDLRQVSLAGVVESAARTFRGLAAQSGFELQVECVPDLPAALADRDAIEQAILNLLSNAMKYSGASRVIGLRLEREEAYGAIRVVDHGVGIAPEEQRKIFERFYRVGSAGDREIPGTGLGLTLVEHIATAHGGQVTVRSVVGEGSTFTLLIPFAAQGAGALEER